MAGAADERSAKAYPGSWGSRSDRSSASSGSPSRSSPTSRVSNRQILIPCELSPDAEYLLDRAMQQRGLAARSHTSQSGRTIG